MAGKGGQCTHGLGREFHSPATELDTTLSLTPDHYRANLLRGRILSLQGKPDDALPNLQKAAKVQPDSKEAHLFLSHAYTQLNRDADAAQERAKAQSQR